MLASANATSIGSEAAFVRMRIAMSRWAYPLATSSLIRAATAAASSESSAHATISGATPEGRCERNQTAVPGPVPARATGPPGPSPRPPPADPTAPAAPRPAPRPTRRPTRRRRHQRAPPTPTARRRTPDDRVGHRHDLRRAPVAAVQPHLGGVRPAAGELHPTRPGWPPRTSRWSGWRRRRRRRRRGRPATRRAAGPGQGVMSWYSSTVNQRYCERIASAMSGRSPIRATISSRTSSKSIAPAWDFTSW